MAVKRIPLANEPITGSETVADYDAYARLYMTPEYRYFVRRILRLGIRSGKVLDVGTGSGRLAIELARAKGCNFDIIGLDLSADMLRKAQENVKKAGVEGRIQYILTSAATLPFANQSFDLVVSYASLHHWQSPVKVLDEIYRVTKEPGMAIIRDNLRVYGNLFWEAFIRVFTLFQKKSYREKWPKAILASYTVQEAEELVRQSSWKNYHLSADFVRLDLCLEATK